MARAFNQTQRSALGAGGTAVQREPAHRHTSPRTLRLSGDDPPDEHIRAPRSAVYRALPDRDAVQQWMVPDGMTSHVELFEPYEAVFGDSRPGDRRLGGPAPSSAAFIAGRTRPLP